MKNYLIVLSLVMIAFSACKKDPKNVVLTADKTSVVKGGSVTFSCKDDGKKDWFEYYRKKPNETEGIDLGGTAGNSLDAYFDSTGTYIIYAIAYDNLTNANEFKDYKYQTKSNEISITVTP